MVELLPSSCDRCGLYMVARALLDGTITRASYDLANLSDPRMLAIIDKIVVHEDPVLAAQMPSLANRVTIVLKGGLSLVEEFGMKDNPCTGISDAEIELKFRDLFRDFAKGYYSEERVKTLLVSCWEFELQSDLSEFVAAFDLSIL